MRQFVRGERAALAELAAIHHLWDVEISVNAPFYIVDFGCLGLDENGEVFDDAFLINFNRPEAPRGAIRLDNASNNGAVFSLALEELPPRVRRLVFTASVGQNPLPGGLVGAAFSLFGVNADIGVGHLILATPAAEMGFFEFSGQDFAGERTLVVGELYLRDEWRFVAAGQPLQGELSAFLRTLTQGPTPAPLSTPLSRPAATLSAPARLPRPVAPPPIRTAPRPAAPVLAPPRAPVPVAIPTPQPRPNPAPNRVSTPLPTAPATIQLPATTINPPVAPPIPAPVSAPAAPLNLPQSVPPGGKLQDLIDAAAPGSTLILQRGEYRGPLLIAKPLALEGRESAIWLQDGPAITIASPGVSLHDLDIEITVSAQDGGEKGVALLVQSADLPLELDGVQLRGRLAGIGAGDGAWKLPRALKLGEFAARAANEWHFEVEVPCEVALRASIGGLAVEPSRIEAGTHQITLRAHDVAPDTLLVGELEVRGQAVVFRVPLHGQAAQGMRVGD